MKKIKKRKLNKLLSKGGGRTKKRRTCPFSILAVETIDYKDVETLKQFVTERGKILPRRITGITAHYQKLMCSAIKKARMVALLPFAGDVQV
jgi:small subunit ribosomal protein S18